METVTPAVSVIITKKDKVLLVRHKKDSKHPIGVYGLPGGKKENYESFEDAACREVKEETGIEINKRDLNFIGRYKIKVERKIGEEYADMLLYICERFRGSLKESSETKPIWVNIQDFILDKYKIPKITQSFVSDVKKVLKQKI